MNGNKIGHFRNDDRTDSILLPFLYLCSLAIFYSLLKGGVTLENTKQRVMGIVSILILALLPMFLIAGAVKYADYYTTNKKWKTFKGAIISKSQHGGGRSGPIYYYLIKNADTSLELSSGLSYEVGQTLKLKLCVTNLGITVAD